MADELPTIEDARMHFVRGSWARYRNAMEDILRDRNRKLDAISRVLAQRNANPHEQIAAIETILG